ncbi:MAG: RNA 2',3'-cyclic phosphodiesterase, partial [Fibrobacter sp.]|nr:RNA 2',3'-cyclic phosphodiesterase [Fibrobacter sp.]
MARLFIAVDIPQRIKDDIVSTYLAIPGAKWVKEDQLHITL